MACERYFDLKVCRGTVERLTRSVGYCLMMRRLEGAVGPVMAACVTVSVWLPMKIDLVRESVVSFAAIV